MHDMQRKRKGRLLEATKNTFESYKQLQEVKKIKFNKSLGLNKLVL